MRCVWWVVRGSHLQAVLPKEQSAGCANSCTPTPTAHARVHAKTRIGAVRPLEQQEERVASDLRKVDEARASEKAEDVALHLAGADHQKVFGRLPVLPRPSKLLLQHLVVDAAARQLLAFLLAGLDQLQRRPHARLREAVPYTKPAGVLAQEGAKLVDEDDLLGVAAGVHEAHFAARPEELLGWAEALGDAHAEADHARALRIAPPVERANLWDVSVVVDGEGAKLRRHAARVRLHHEVERHIALVHVCRVGLHLHPAVGVRRLDADVKQATLAAAAVGRAPGGGESEAEAVHGQRRRRRLRVFL
eukprot:7377258-Prymnesium_polylepis.1